MQQQTGCWSDAWSDDMSDDSESASDIGQPMSVDFSQIDLVSSSWDEETFEGSDSTFEGSDCSPGTASSGGSPWDDTDSEPFQLRAPPRLEGQKGCRLVQAAGTGGATTAVKPPANPWAALRWQGKWCWSEPEMPVGLIYELLSDPTFIGSGDRPRRLMDTDFPRGRLRLLFVEQFSVPKTDGTFGIKRRQNGMDKWHARSSKSDTTYYWCGHSMRKGLGARDGKQVPKGTWGVKQQYSDVRVYVNADGLMSLAPTDMASTAVALVKSQEYSKVMTTADFSEEKSTIMKDCSKDARQLYIMPTKSWFGQVSPRPKASGGRRNVAAAAAAPVGQQAGASKRPREAVAVEKATRWRDGGRNTSSRVPRVSTGDERKCDADATSDSASDGWASDAYSDREICFGLAGVDSSAATSPLGGGSAASWSPFMDETGSDLSECSSDDGSSPPLRLSLDWSAASSLPMLTSKEVY